MQVSHLKTREIQAPIVSALVRGFAEAVGHDRAVAIAEQVIRADAVAAGKQMAAAYGGNSMAVLARIVRKIWAADNTLTLRFIEQSDTALSFDVVRCGYVELYDQLGVRPLGCLLSCTRDFYFLEGFNPGIHLSRTRTIMDGETVCDFRYTMQ